MPPHRFMRAVIWGVDKGAALIGKDPLHWLTVGERESDNWSTATVTLCETGGRTYVVDNYPDRIGDRPVSRWGDAVRPFGRGTLTHGRADTDVTLTEVTDPALRHQVITLAMKDETPYELGLALSRAIAFEVARV